MEEMVETDSSLNDTGHKDTLIFTLSNEPSFEVTNSQILDDRDFKKNTYIFTLPRDKTIILEIEKPSRELIYFAIFFVSLQIADGMLTSIGVARFGISGEGNPFLKDLMLKYGPDKALFMVKAAAIFIIAGLTALAKRAPFVKDVIGTLSCVYLFAAIIPWVYIITHYFD